MLESASPSATITVSPDMINTKQDFCGSIFSNRETEKVIRGIVILQKKKNPFRWTEFTFKEYHDSCGHPVSFEDSLDEQILNALVQGGPPLVSCSRKKFEPGYLSFSGTFYKISPKLIEALVPFLKK